MLEIENLRFGYSGIAGEAPLLHVEKFQLKDNEHLLIQGNSGSGKTSLLFLLGGLLLPNAGEIRLNGTNFAALSNSARDAYRGRHIGFVFQQPHLMAPLSVLDNVLVAPFMGSVPVEKTYALSLLEKLGLGKLLHRKPSELSQGQMQRVGVARALVHKPTLVLADEPTSALDDEASKATISLLQAYARDAGAQLVVASHDARIKVHFKQVLNVGGAR